MDDLIPFKTGEKLADERYCIIERVGSGTEGDVYKAQDEWLDETVALKFLTPREGSDPFHEVKIVRGLEHPNICRILSVDRARGKHYVAMSYYDCTLAALLVQNRGKLAKATALAIGTELCAGLRAIHSEGILHRDLKPANIMVDKLGRARIADFGLASDAATRQGAAGTLPYMAPEVCALEGTSVRSDLYSLGLVLYELFLGRPAFSSKQDLTWDQWAETHRQGPPRPREIDPDLDAAIEEAILQCIALDPADRPSSAAEVAAVLGVDLDAEDEALPPPPSELPELSDFISDEFAASALSPVLAAYLRGVQDDHALLLPFFQRGGDVLLEHVYVELRLEPRRMGDLDGSWISDDMLGMFAGLSLSLQDALEFSPDRYGWVTRRWLIRGDPGAGKTTLLRFFAERLAADGGEPWTPLLVSLPRWARDQENPETRGGLFESADARMQRAGHAPGALLAEFERLAEEGRLLLLLDGLDEVPREHRDMVREMLRDVANRWSETPIVVTTRPIGSERPGTDFVEIELLPFDHVRRRSFLARWLGRDQGKPDWRRADELIQILDDDVNLRELASNPLYLTLTALLHESGERPEKKRAKLYDQLFELLAEGRHRRPSRRLDHWESARRALRFLAYGMTLDNRDSEPLQALEKRFREPEAASLRERLAELKEHWRNPRAVLVDLAEHTGILGPHDGRSADWRFWHRTFREALASEALAQRLEDEGRAALLEHAASITEDQGRWAEPYALLVGRVERPDALVKELVGVNRDLGLRAVATAQGLSPNTLREVLKLSYKWTERRDVFLRIPDLIDDPERSLCLVDQLRRMTRNGNDLFFLGLAIDEVARRWPEFSASASGHRDRLYDHIPLGDLFQTIETPIDGVVELWREIPAGEFLMGSGEFVGFDFERPEHRVEVAHPFRLAAVPVTNRQYAAFDPERADMDRPDHPVSDVTYFEATAFSAWLSRFIPGVRLPTEVEWEYACRGGTTAEYWSGDDEKDLDRVGWYGGNSGSELHRVGEKSANPFGLYDTHGNVWEWTRSGWTDNYSRWREGRYVDPRSADTAASAPRVDLVIRGGNYDDAADVSRSAYRSRFRPGGSWSYVGFRLVSAVPETKDD